jgi:hypothetical protein
MRKYLSLSVRQYAHAMGCGVDAAYADIKEGGIESVKIGKRKIRITAAAAEKKLGVNPGDLDDKIDEMED